MTTDQLPSLGPPDFHEGQVARVRAGPGVVRVEVRGCTGLRYAVVFTGAFEVRSHHGDGMLLDALMERPGSGQVRRFVFTNADHQDDACLEVDARDVRIEPIDAGRGPQSGST